MKPGAREAVFAAVLLGIGLGVWFKVLVPRNEAIAAMEEQRVAGQSGLTQINTRIPLAEARLDTDLQALSLALAEATQRVPARASTEVVMNTVQRLCRQHGLVIQNLYALPEPPRSMEGMLAGMPYKQHWVEFEMTGSLSSLYTFLQELETQPRSIRVPDLTITYAGAPLDPKGSDVDLPTPQQQSELQIKMRLQVFSRSEETKP